MFCESLSLLKKKLFTCCFSTKCTHPLECVGDCGHRCVNDWIFISGCGWCSPLPLPVALTTVNMSLVFFAVYIAVPHVCRPVCLRPCVETHQWGRKKNLTHDTDCWLNNHWQLAQRTWIAQAKNRTVFEDVKLRFEVEKRPLLTRNENCGTASSLLSILAVCRRKHRQLCYSAQP